MEGALHARAERSRWNSPSGGTAAAGAPPRRGTRQKKENVASATQICGRAAEAAVGDLDREHGRYTHPSTVMQGALAQGSSKVTMD